MTNSKIELIQKTINKYESKIASVLISREMNMTNERIIEEVAEDIYVCDSGLLYFLKIRASDLTELKLLRAFDFENLAI